MKFVLYIISAWITSTEASVGDFAFALDLTSPLDLFGAKCIKESLYPTVFLRGSSPYDLRQTDICESVRNAKDAGLQVEIFMTPDPLQEGSQQLENLCRTLQRCGFNVRSIWLQVTSPINWPDTPRKNVEFIDRVIAKASEFGIALGIYTNHYDWKQITGGNISMDKVRMLWYWSVPQVGPDAEDHPNFDNFRQFGPWKTPAAKQFGQMELICGYITNRNIYRPSRVTSGIGTGISLDNSRDIGFIGLD